jgi:type 2 lantibiotic biosynthesis protein LanM
MGVVIPDDRLRGIAWRGMGLFERLAALPDVGESGVEPGSRARGLLDRWRDTVGNSDATRFSRRLEWSGISPEAVEWVLSHEAPPRGLEIPGWARLLREVLSEIPGGAEAGGGVSAEDGPIPFEEVLRPFVTWATRKAKHRAPSIRDLFSPRSVEDARRGLLRRLSDRSAITLLAEFRRGSHGYAHFTGTMDAGRWMDLFEEYPVLARQFGSTILFWIDGLIELALRLAQDGSALAEAVGDGSGGGDANGPGMVDRIHFGAGDFHDGGRATAILTFENGTRVVYKPRDLCAEAAWFGLLSWLNRRAGDGVEMFRTLRVLPRDGYGWMEFADPAPLEDDGQAAEYYRNAGRMVCLVYVLGGVDCHFENLVASGSDPILVDLETILQPRPRRDHAGAPGSPRAHSVMRGWMLPSWKSPVEGGKPLDLSALGCQESQETEFPEWVWSDVNTDRMSVQERPMSLVPRSNRVVGPSGQPRLSEFLDPLIEGFDEMYRWILREREVWLSQPDPIVEMRSCSIRVLLRATATYGKVLHRGTAPDLLRDGVEWSIHADVVASAWLGWKQPPPLWGALEAEHAALLVGDVPRFETRGDSPDLPLGSTPDLVGCFQEGAFDRFLTTLGELDEADRAEQVARIRQSVATWEMVRRGDSDFDLYLAASLSPD